MACPSPNTQHSSEKPLRYGMLVYPGFQALDVFGPLDAFATLTNTYPLTLSIISENLHPVPTRAPKSVHGSHFAQSVVPTHTLSDAPPLDVLLIPGGIGNRPPANMDPYIDFIKATYPNLQYLLTVCTGSYIAARTGLLDGRRATTNKAVFRDITSQYPKVNWVPKARWVVDGNIWTSSGVSAGIDLALAFISERYGRDQAVSISNTLEYQWHEDADWDPFAAIYGLV